IRTLLPRLQDGEVQEVVIATDPNLEGEATATYLIRLLSSVGITVSRLASGLPVGGDLEYADERSEERRVGKEGRAGGGAAQAEDGIRDFHVTGVQTCALPISSAPSCRASRTARCRRSSSRPTPTSRARRPPPTSSASCPAWASRCPAWPPDSRWAATWSTRTRDRKSDV